MIVLAIAGMILLIVFLVVPALQRNARNTQRKNDAAQISAAIATYISNTNTPPKTMGVDPQPNTVDLCAATCGTSVGDTVRLGFYTPPVLGSNIGLRNPPDSAGKNETDPD